MAYPSIVTGPYAYQGANAQGTMQQGAVNPYGGVFAQGTAQQPFNYAQQGTVSPGMVQGAVQGANAQNPMVQGALSGVQNQMTYSNTYTPGAGYYGKDKGWGVASQGQGMGPGYQGTGQGPMSSFTSPQQSGGGVFQGASPQGGFNTIGQLSPEEQARNARIMGAPVGGNSQGGNQSGTGGIGSSGTGQAGGGQQQQPSSSGLNLGNIGPSSPQNSSPNFPATSAYSAPMIGYAAPGGASQGMNVPQQGGAIQMQQSNPQDALGQYQNTAGYQLMNAPGAYQQSPGYQYAMDQAMGQVQNQASARGMLESGAVLKSMQQTASGLAQQDYGNWWNRQSQLYGDYQNRLQGLAGGPTGAQDAMTTGTNLAQGTLQTGSNIGSLFGNQGSIGMGGIVNTGAAQSNNMTNAGTQQAQVGAANQATQLAGATLAGNQQRGLF